MFFAIFINMNKSATLKLDKFIQEILAESTDPNSPFYVKPKPSLEDLGIYPNTMPVSPSDRLTKANYTTLGTIAKSNAIAAELELWKTDPWAAKENAVAAADQRAAKAIAKTIYDAKGTFSDDMYLAVKAIKQIKDAKQFELVQTELQKLTNGRGIGTYIASFLGTMIGGVVDLNLAETLRYGETIVKHLKSIKADAATIKIIDDRIAKASMQKALTPALVTLNVPGANVIQTVNAVNDWTYDHNTWDTLINGANGANDGLRGAAYTIPGVIISTILAGIPQTKAVPVVIFGLLAIDDVYQIVKGNYGIETWVNLIVDLFGVFAGGASSSIKGAIRPIAALMNAVSKGVKGKALLPLVEAVQKMTIWFRNTKFGQLLIKLGEDIVTFIVSLIKNLCTQFITALKLFAKKYPKLMGWCTDLIDEIAYHIQIFVSDIKEIWANLKILWKVISLPGKEADWIVQNVILRKANIVVRGAFGAGAKVAVNFGGLTYMFAPDVEKQLNQEIADNEEKMIANVVSAHAGNIIGFPKTGNKIYVYLKDDSQPGGYLYAGSRETFNVPVTLGDTTTLQPVGVRIHQETKNGHWVQISMTKNIEEYNLGKFGETELWWTDSRQLEQLNRVPLDKYITITPIKENNIMKTTILTQIIKKVILTEQGGFRKDTIPAKIKVPLVPVVKKKVEPKVVKKVEPTVAPKDAKSGSFKSNTDQFRQSTTDVLLNPPEWPEDGIHRIYSKTGEGIWRYEYRDAESNTVKSSILSDASIKAKLDAGKHIPWPKKYSGFADKTTKLKWLELMDKRDPAFPEKSQDVVAGGTGSLIMTMLAQYGIQVLGGLVVSFLTYKKLIKPGFKWAWQAAGFGRESNLIAMHGINAEELARLERVVAQSLRNGEITSSQAKSLRKSFNNPWYQSSVNKATFNTAHDAMIKGEMTMDEFIKLMPKVYQQNDALKRVLFEYEAQLNSMYPSRKAAWDIAAAKYAQRNSQFAAKHRAEIEQQLDNMMTKIGIPKNDLYRSMFDPTATSTFDFATGKMSSFPSIKIKPGITDPASIMSMNFAKISKSVDDAVTAARADATSYKKFMNLGRMTKDKFINVGTMTLMQWGRSLANSNYSAIPKLLNELANLKTEKDAIAKIKQFGVENNWDVVKDAAFIEELMFHTLKYFKK